MGSINATYYTKRGGLQRDPSCIISDGVPECSVELHFSIQVSGTVTSEVGPSQEGSPAPAMAPNRHWGPVELGVTCPWLPHNIPKW